jgi:hypothetical protein
MYRHDNVSNALVDGQFVFLLVLDKSYRLYFTVVNWCRLVYGCMDH